QYPTIQAAVDAAEDGDKVQVAAGTYAESVTWTAKSLRLVGAGPDETIVDPSLGPGGRCFTLVDVPSGAVAKGFTCQHGQVGIGDGGGGGMLIQNGSPTIRDFVFNANSARSPGGGGVEVQGGSPD